MFATKTIISASHPGSIWDILTDLHHWPDWNPELLRVKMKKNLDTGVCGKIFYRHGWRTRFTVTQYVPGSSYTLSFKNLLADVHIRRYIGYHNHKTTITNEIWAEGVLSDLWWALFSSSWVKMLEAEMKELKKITEHDALTLQKGQPAFG